MISCSYISTATSSILISMVKIRLAMRCLVRLLVGSHTFGLDPDLTVELSVSENQNQSIRFKELSFNKKTNQLGLGYSNDRPTSYILPSHRSIRRSRNRSSSDPDWADSLIPLVLSPSVSHRVHIRVEDALGIRSLNNAAPLYGGGILLR